VLNFVVLKEEFKAGAGRGFLPVLVKGVFLSV
jgi:hypothetical protein